jgi:hypothetical protein
MYISDPDSSWCLLANSVDLRLGKSGTGFYQCGLLLGGIYKKMAKLGLRHFLKVITVLETL